MKVCSGEKRNDMHVNEECTSEDSSSKGSEGG